MLTLFRIAAIPAVVMVFFQRHPVENAGRWRRSSSVLRRSPISSTAGWRALRADVAFRRVPRPGRRQADGRDRAWSCSSQAESGWFEDIIAMIIIGREITISALREWMATIGERANREGFIPASSRPRSRCSASLSWSTSKTCSASISIYVGWLRAAVVRGVMTIWSMFIYLKAAWPFIMADNDDEFWGQRRDAP